MNHLNIRYGFFYNGEGAERARFSIDLWEQFTNECKIDDKLIYTDFFIENPFPHGQTADCHNALTWIPSKIKYDDVSILNFFAVIKKEKKLRYCLNTSIKKLVPRFYSRGILDKAEFSKREILDDFKKNKKKYEKYSNISDFDKNLSILTNIVYEKGISDIIIDYKNDIEETRLYHYLDKLYSICFIIDYYFNPTTFFLTNTNNSDEDSDEDKTLFEFFLMIKDKRREENNITPTLITPTMI
jgi:hypothetical protein